MLPMNGNNIRNMETLLRNISEIENPIANIFNNNSGLPFKIAIEFLSVELLFQTTEFNFCAL